MKIVLSLILAVSGYFTIDSMMDNPMEAHPYTEYTEEDTNKETTYGYWHEKMHDGTTWEFMEYKHELIESYDWVNMTEEEIELAKIEIEVLLNAKAEELGIDFSNYYSWNHMGSFGHMYQNDDYYEYMIYKKELVASYNWDELDEIETEIAKQEIELLLLDKAEELGLETEIEKPYGYGNRIGRGYCH